MPRSITIDGFSIANTTSKGIAARGATPEAPMNGLIIRNNDVTDTQEEGMYLSEVANSLVENNTLTNVGKGGIQTTGHGIYLANSGSKNTTIRGNTFPRRPTRGAKVCTSMATSPSAATASFPGW